MVSLGIPSWPKQNSQLETMRSKWVLWVGPLQRAPPVFLWKHLQGGMGSKAALPTGSYSTHLAPACMSLNCPHHSPPGSWLSPHGSLLLLFMIPITL